MTLLTIAVTRHNLLAQNKTVFTEFTNGALDFLTDYLWLKIGSEVNTYALELKRRFRQEKGRIHYWIRPKYEDDVIELTIDPFPFILLIIVVIMWMISYLQRFTVN